MKAHFEVYTVDGEVICFFSLAGCFAWIEQKGPGCVRHIYDLRSGNRINAVTGLVE
jgi:hypothetical protein